ncbi:hypothetical protein ACFPRL_19965 [Pseudoclavibacter helvolus]
MAKSARADEAASCPCPEWPACTSVVAPTPTAAGGVPSTNSVWNRNWLAPTESARRTESVRMRASSRQASTASPNGNAMPTRPGMPPPAKTCEARAMNVETDAAINARRTRRTLAASRGRASTGGARLASRSR